MSRTIMRRGPIAAPALAPGDRPGKVGGGKEVFVFVVVVLFGSEVCAAGGDVRSEEFLSVVSLPPGEEEVFVDVDEEVRVDSDDSLERLSEVDLDGEGSREADLEALEESSALVTLSPHLVAVHVDIDKPSAMQSLCHFPHSNEGTVCAYSLKSGSVPMMHLQVY